jgi:Tfp pilus assembly protein PilF
MGIIYMKKSQPYNAMKYLKQCIQFNQRYKPAYYAMAEILKKTGKPEQAERYLQVANSF